MTSLALHSEPQAPGRTSASSGRPRQVAICRRILCPSVVDTGFIGRMLYFLPMNKTPGDYRIFVGAFPLGELAERIQTVRLRHDAKTARITAPHVTMAGTYWRSGLATPENESDAIARLQAVQGQLQPFELALGGVESFLPHVLVVYLRVEPTAGLLAARQVLLDALGPDKDRHYTPHLTLTMRLDKHRTHAAQRVEAERVAHTPLVCADGSSLAHATRVT